MRAVEVWEEVTVVVAAVVAALVARSANSHLDTVCYLRPLVVRQTPLACSTCSLEDEQMYMFPS